MISDRLKLLGLIDLLAVCAYGLLLPILPLFLIDQFYDSNIFNIALAYTFYLISMAGFSWIFRIFIEHGLSIVRIKLGLIASTLILAVMPILYMYAKTMTDIYLIQIFIGMAFGIMKIAWHKLTHEKLTDTVSLEAFSHTRNLFTTFGLGIAAVLGGFIAYQYSYRPLLCLVFSFAFTSFASSLIYIFTSEKKHKATKRPSH
ncbi:MAG: hypothetical protein ACOYUZ_01500 [Patescibacteria group bacterium]